jgi:hypothetical protein
MEGLPTDHDRQKSINMGHEVPGGVIIGRGVDWGGVPAQGVGTEEGYMDDRSPSGSLLCKS